MSIVVTVTVSCGSDDCVGNDCGGGGVAAAALLLQHAGLSALGRYRGQDPPPRRPHTRKRQCSIVYSSCHGEFTNGYKTLRKYLQNGRQRCIANIIVQMHAILRPRHPRADFRGHRFVQRR